MHPRSFRDPSQKKNVLFVLHLPPPIHGHAVVGSYIKNSAKINTLFDCHYINLSISENLKSVGTISFKKYIKALKTTWQVLVSLLKYKYDLCYITPSVRTPAFYKDFAVIFLLKLFNVKIIYHIHNKGIGDCTNTWFNKMLFSYAFRNEKVILLSEKLYGEFMPYVKPQNLSICPNGIPVNTDVVRNRTDKQPRLLFLSNLVIEKGILVFLKACHILHSNNIDFRADIIGDWAEIGQDEFAVILDKLNLTDKVTAHGKKFDNEKLQFVADADIFVFPTYYKNETFGLVNLEAMQFGLPIISTNTGAISDVVINNVSGFLTPPDDEVAVAEKLTWFLDNPDKLADMGAAGKNRFEQLFTLDIFEHNMCSILANAVNQPHLSPLI